MKDLAVRSHAFASIGLVTLLVVAAPVLSAPPAVEGAWSIRERSSADGRVQLDLRRRAGSRHSWSSSFPIPFSELSGLTAEALSGPPARVRFSLRRDAGTIAFEGDLDQGEGSGRFAFTPDDGYLREMRSLGYSIDEEEALSAAVHDVSRAFVRELASVGHPRLALDDLFAFRIHGVSPALIRELQGLGYASLSAEDLVAMRIHRATPDVIRALSEAGFGGLSAESLVAFQIHRVSPTFLAALKAAGVEATADEAVALRIHGATPEYLEALARLGYRGVDADDLVAMRIHGVTPEFIAGLQELGYEHPTPDQLVASRIHGVTKAFATRMNAKRGAAYSLEDLVSLKIHGR